MLKPATYPVKLLLLLLTLLVGAGTTRAQVLRGTFAAGVHHALSIHADGTLWATGANNYGELGDGTTTGRNTWRQVGTATNWVQVTAGNEFSLGIQADGTLGAGVITTMAS